MIFFYTMVEKTPEAGNQEEKETYPVLKTYRVFNLDQIEGLNQEDSAFVETPPDFEPLDHVEDFLVGTRASIHYGGQRAFFRPSTDEIMIPERSRFAHAADFYATILHELHALDRSQSRLNREGGRVFGDKAYAFEELVAELGSAFLMADLGVEGDVQHESTLASWIDALKEDKRVIFRAATLASRAHQYLMSMRNTQVSQAA